MGSCCSSDDPDAVEEIKIDNLADAVEMNENENDEEGNQANAGGKRNKYAIGNGNNHYADDDCNTLNSNVKGGTLNGTSNDTYQTKDEMHAEEVEDVVNKADKEESMQDLLAKYVDVNMPHTRINVDVNVHKPVCRCIYGVFTVHVLFGLSMDLWV